MKVIALIFTCFYFSISSFAQGNSIEINKDPRIDMMIKQEGAIIAPATSPQIIGYRIQLFFDSNKSAVDEARSKFMAMYPKVDTYVAYISPHFFLKVGDFRTQMEAEKIKSKVENQFPTSNIIKEKINLPRIDQ
ncbi:MAG: hypothetical protein PHQ74_00515 [Crocinitomicaceae bacterium]|nr:hypothetical protein [Crocinitomicaceae bacterium]